MILFFDTETTGLPDFWRPSHLPSQPDICQLAALLTDDEGEKRGSIDLLIQPEGWTLEGTEAQRSNNLTDDICRRFGVPIGLALDAFMELLGRAELSVAYNRGFDAKMIRIALKKRGDPRADVLKEHPKGDPIHPGRKAMNSKHVPKLVDLYEYFFDEPILGAHNAAKDVMAVRRIWFHMRGLGLL